jgi:hypothetical protein
MRRAAGMFCEFGGRSRSGRGHRFGAPHPPGQRATPGRSGPSVPKPGLSGHCGRGRISISITSVSCWERTILGLSPRVRHNRCAGAASLSRPQAMPRTPRWAAPSTRTRRRSAPSPRRRRAGVTATIAWAHPAWGGASTATPTSSPPSVTGRCHRSTPRPAGEPGTWMPRRSGSDQLGHPPGSTPGAAGPSGGAPARGDREAWRPGERSAWSWAVPVLRPSSR